MSGVRARVVTGGRPALSRFYFEDRVEPVTPAELEAAHHEHHPAGDHEAIESSEQTERTPVAGQ